MASADRFVINKNMDNVFTLTVKQTGTTLPMEVTATDSFEARLVKLTDGLEVPNAVTVEFESNMNGKIQLTIPKNVANTLYSEKGDKVDRYYSKPTYKLILNCKTQNNGDFIAKVPLVYVEE